MAETNKRVGPEPFTVRPAMLNGVRHPPKKCDGHRTPVDIKYSRYAAHVKAVRFESALTSGGERDLGRTLGDELLMRIPPLYQTH